MRVRESLARVGAAIVDETKWGQCALESLRDRNRKLCLGCDENGSSLAPLAMTGQPRCVTKGAGSGTFRLAYLQPFTRRHELYNSMSMGRSSTPLDWSVVLN